MSGKWRRRKRLRKEKYPLLFIYVNTLGSILSKLFITFFHHKSKFLDEFDGLKAENSIAALLYDNMNKQIYEGEILNYIQLIQEDSIFYLLLYLQI